MITVRYRAELQKLVNKETELLQAARISDVLAYIKRSYGKEAYKQARSMLITVNGVSICLNNNRRTLLQDGAVVSFFPVSGGG